MPPSPPTPDQVVLCHETADFDAFACLMAAARLYPGAQPILGKRLIPPLRHFLSLHKDHFPVPRYTDVDTAAVERVILVDVHRWDRLAAPEELVKRLRRQPRELEVHVWDHHAVSDHDVLGEREVVEPVGAAVTLLVEALRHRELAVSSMEATLFLLGIYSDTGSLRFSSTTSRDVAAAAWLMDQGASLPVVNRYLATTLTPEQRQVLALLLGRAEVHPIGGLEMAFASLELPAFVDGLAMVTRQVMELEGHPALFAAYRLGDKGVQVIARSRVPFVHVGRTLRPLGGGGHSGAGAAKLKEEDDPEAVLERILKILRADPPRPRTVREVMSSPVHTVPPETPLATLRRSLAAWRHSGVPVIRDGRLVGIISRRDVEKAERDGREQLTVASCMSGRVHTIEPRATLEEALQRMVAEDVGRLPVLVAGRLVGIITRTDLTRILYDPEGEPVAR